MRPAALAAVFSLGSSVLPAVAQGDDPFSRMPDVAREPIHIRINGL
jgi:hypothetical protein